MGSFGERYLFGCTEPVPHCAQDLGCVLGVFGFGRSRGPDGVDGVREDLSFGLPAC